MMKRRINQRLSKEDKLLIKTLTNKGKSLRYISKLTNLGITTIYYQVRKFKPKQRRELLVSLSEEKIGELMGLLQVMEVFITPLIIKKTKIKADSTE